MAIKGPLTEASLADVLQLLTLGRKTGCLSLTQEKNFGSIYFDNGCITYASIVNRRDRIGERLVHAGAISREELRAAVEEQSTRRDLRLGDLLVERGAITRATLDEHVAEQVRETVYLLYTWDHGTFHFDAGARPRQQESLVSIHPESLLLEGARRVDEWGLIQESIPSLDIVFEVDQAALAASAEWPAAGQRWVLDLVDGARDVTAIIEESGLSEFDVGTVLHALRVSGIIREVHRPAAPEPHALGSRVDEHRNLGAAFYRVAMFDESAREFRRVLELEPGDRRARAQLGLIHMRQGHWQDAVGEYEVLAAARPTAATFHNLALALERLGRYEDARTALESAAALSGERDARVQTSLGAVCLLQGEARAADETLGAAKALWAPHPSPWWYHYAALAAARIGDLARARALLEEGVAKHPGVAVLDNNLAAIQERLGAHPEALASARRGLQADPAIPQLHKNVGDLLYRAGRHAEACEAFQQSVKLGPGRGSDVYLKLGNILLKRQQFADASACWRQALELDPDNAIARNNLDALARMGA